MKTTYSLFLLSLFYSCAERASQTDSTIIVSEYYKSNDLNEPPPPPLSPYGYYGCFNFIVDSSSKIYYYQHFYNRKQKPVTVVDFDSNAPIFINLNPNHIIEIPEDGMKAFLEHNILNADLNYRKVRVIGITDTLRSKGLAPLMQILNDTANHMQYIIRRITQEEKIVLDFKEKQDYYSSDNIKWDSSKIWFDKKQPD